MNSTLERKWWFAGPVTGLAAILAIMLAGAAGLQQPFSAAQWLLYLLAFFGIQRSLSFAGWLLALWLAPAYVTSQRS